MDDSFAWQCVGVCRSTSVGVSLDDRFFFDVATGSNAPMVKTKIERKGVTKKESSDKDFYRENGGMYCL